MDSTEYNELENGQEWPPFYPDDLVLPPSDSSQTEGSFYRLVSHSPPQEECFFSTHEEQPDRHIKYRFNGDTRNLENVYGTSFYNQKEAVVNIKDKFPQALGSKLVAKGDLEHSVGRMRQHPKGSPHYTVWIRKYMSPYNSFLVEQEDSQ